jgi:hypothetical protein
MTQVLAICQAAYQALQADFQSTLYVARVAPFALAELPVTNIWPVGEPAADRHSGKIKRELELAIVSQVTGEEPLKQIEQRRSIIHRALLAGGGLDGACQVVQAGDWHVDPVPDLPVLMLTQQFFVYYQRDYLEV